MLWSCAVPVLGAPFLAIWTQLSQFQQQIYVFPPRCESTMSKENHLSSPQFLSSEQVPSNKTPLWNQSFFFLSTQLSSPTLKKKKTSRIRRFHCSQLTLRKPYWLTGRKTPSYLLLFSKHRLLSEELMPATSKQTLPTSSTPHHLLLFRAHSTQQRRVRCLQLGAVSKSSQTNISFSCSAAMFVTVTRAFVLGLHTLLGKTTVCGKLNQSLSANQSRRPSSCIWGDF